MSIRNSIMITMTFLAACGGEPEAPYAEQVQHFSSPRGTLANMTFDGEAVVDCYKAADQIQDQLLYTVGHLNQDNSVVRIDSLKVTQIKTMSQGRSGAAGAE